LPTKLEKLTPEQEALMAAVRDEWISFALVSKEQMNKPAVKQGIEWIYSLAKLKQPEIIYAKSPMACQIIANLYGNPSVWDSVGDSVRASVRASVRDSVWASVRDSVWDSVRDSVWDSVRDSVWDSVRDSVRDSKLEYFYPAWRDLLSDSYWVAFYDYFTRIGIINHSNFNKYLAYMKAGAFYSIFLEGFAIVCERPEYISRDSEGRLHAENKPAVLWKDGYAQYFWHGVSVSQKLIETPEQITKEDLQNETNAERRRAMMEKLGEKFYELLDVQEASRDFVGVGPYVQEAVLYRTKVKDTVANEHIQYVQVKCHSTGRKYMLCVPPDITDPLTAVAWTFSKKPEEYAPLVET
jgi:hypothetical protein